MGYSKYMEDNVENLFDRKYFYDAWHENIEEIESMAVADLIQKAASNNKPDIIEPKRIRKKQQSDKHIICKDCGAEFVLTKKEQKWFRKKELSEPKRCEKCRASRRAIKNMSA